MDDKYIGKVISEGGLLSAETGHYRPTIAEVLQKEAMSNACRQSLFDSLVSRIRHAESSANEGAKLHRLAELFDKHPDVREMFELIRDLGIL